MVEVVPQDVLAPVLVLRLQGDGVITNPKGTKLETATVNWLKAHGWQWARRLAKEGAKDRGDVTLGDGIPVTVECKDRKGFDMAQTQRELKAEMENAGTKWGFAIHKKRGTTDVGEYYAVLPVALMMEILEQALGQPAPPVEKLISRAEPVKRRRVIPRLEAD